MTHPNSELESLLIDALEDAAGDTPEDEAIRASLRAGIVGDDAALIDVYERYAGPEQAEVDLHLEGTALQYISTNAHEFAAFVSGISEAVKETAKQKAGRKSYSENLLIRGAEPGSVRVVFRVPEQRQKNKQQSIPTALASSVDSEALRSVAAILTHASSEDPDDSPLMAELAELPIAARPGLKRAASSSRRAGWDIRGQIRQRHIGAQDIALTSAGAFRLNEGLNAKVENRTEQTAVGLIDGFRRSLSTLYFEPSPNGRIIQAAVADETIAAAITDLFAQPDLPVEVVFNVIETSLPGDQERIKRSRSVRRIRRTASPGRQLETES